VTWLDEQSWAEVQRTLPVVVVDVVPLREAHGATLVGLIERETPHQGLRWYLVGGRIRYGETLGAAIRRELREALGEGVAVDVADDAQPQHVAQYGPFGSRPFARDPRKHAVGLTYALPLRGEPSPRAEAVSFSWFPLGALPPHSAWGFEQDGPAEACLRATGLTPTFGDRVEPWRPSA
jgi:ADP-ribose pyrophosphatase YjhB (NUDIX family)